VWHLVRSRLKAGKTPLTARLNVAIAAGTMKTSYCLFTAAGVAAAALAVYTAQYPGWSGSQVVPPLPTRGAAANAAEPPGVLGIAHGGLPPIVLPPDAPLVIPVEGKSPALPVPPMTAEPTRAVPPVSPTPLPTLPAAPAATTPAPLPVPPVTPPARPVEPPVVPPIAPPVVSPAPAVPVPPAESVKPVEPVKPAVPPALMPPVRPVEPVTPPVAPDTPPAKPEVPVAPPPAAVLPKPAPLPQPAQPQPLPLRPPPTKNQTPASGQFVVVKGNKLVEGSVSVAGDKAILRQGSFERTLPRADVLFVAETRDDVYHFMLAQVSATDAAARLGVARWCMFAGLREQALTEAKEILKLQPANTAAADMARSLEESIKLFPTDGSTTVVAARPPGGVLATEPEPDVTPEGAAAFVSRAQPVLANQCMECHARADHAGAFKLIRLTGFEAGPQSTNANLRATAAQIKKDDPLNSPLLTKSLAAHGGMKQPAFVSRQAGAYRVLEAWVLLAAGPIAQPMTPPAQPVLPPATAAPAPAPEPTPALPPVEPPAIPIIPPAVDVPAPVMPTPPVAATPTPPVVAVPSPPVAVPAPPVATSPVVVPPVPVPSDVAPVVVPTVDVPPVVPVAPAIPRVEPQPPAVTVPPLPIEPAPALPVAPPPAETRVPPVLPTPPSMPAADATQKLPKPSKFTAPTNPAAPVIPAGAALPKPPAAVQNAGGIAPGSQFGTQAPPKPPAPTGPAGGDEFDPAAFNKSK
jgi:hypothetical protein